MEICIESRCPHCDGALTAAKNEKGFQIGCPACGPSPIETCRLRIFGLVDFEKLEAVCPEVKDQDWHHGRQLLMGQVACHFSRDEIEIQYGSLVYDRIDRTAPVLIKYDDIPAATQHFQIILTAALIGCASVYWLLIFNCWETAKLKFFLVFVLILVFSYRQSARLEGMSTIYQHDEAKFRLLNSDVDALVMLLQQYAYCVSFFESQASDSVPGSDAPWLMQSPPSERF
jgi:hypothetical protein